MLLKDMFDLSGKNIILTGANSWLGKSMAEALAEYRANLIILSRNKEKNEEIVDYLNNLFRNKNMCYQLDLSNFENIENVFREIIIKYRKIDVLINNAYFGAGGELLSMSDEEWLKGINGSINITYKLTKLVLQNMIKNNYGKIINIASMYGIVAPDIRIYEDNKFYNPANYGVGKAGIIQFTRYIASVYGRYNINCNSISPGPFPNFQVQEDKEFIEKLKNKVPLSKIGRPDDLKGAILLLASDASDFINGANIVVDGGWTIW